MKTIQFANLLVGNIFSWNGVSYQRIADSPAGFGRVKVLNCKDETALNGSVQFFMKSLYVNF